MDRYKSLLSNTVIFAIGTFSSKVLVFLLMPLYTRILTEGEYGTVDLLIQIGNLMLPLASVGIINGVVRFGLDKSYRKSDVFSTGLLCILCGFSILIFFEPIIAGVALLEGHTMLIYVFVLMSTLRSLCSQFVRAKNYVRLYAFDGILCTLTTIIFNILYLVVLDMGITGYILAIVSSDLLSVIFLAFCANLHHYIKFKSMHLDTVKAMLRYSLPLIPNTLFWWITNVSDRYLVTAMKDPASNGLYAVSYKIPTMIVLVSGIFMDAWQMAAVEESNSKKKSAFFSRIFLCFQALVFTASSGIILFSKVITKVLVSPAFYESWRFIPFLVMATSFSCLVNFLGSIYMVEKKSVLNLLTTAAGAVINIILNLLLIPVFGVNGAAFATFVSYFVVFLLRVLDTRRLMKMRWNVGRLIFNILVLLSQSFIMILEINGWIVFEIALTALMLLANLGPLLASLKHILEKKRGK